MSSKFSHSRVMTCAGALALSLAAIGSARANVIWDYSPDTTHAAVGGDYGNTASSQNFLELVSFATSVTLGGMDVFSNSYDGTLGQLATVKIFGSNGNSPSSLLNSVSTSIDVVDSQGTTSKSSISRKHADFGPIALAAGSYWIGMSGTTTELGQGSLLNVQDSRMYQLSGNTLQNFAGVGDMAFVLYGTGSTPVPEPVSMALLGVGVLTVGAAARRKASGQPALS